jgi:hypothetical protein
MAMDAHWTASDGSGQLETVSAGGQNVTVTLDKPPEITLIARADDAESGISNLSITGGTTVGCSSGAGVGTTTQATHGQQSPAGAEPSKSRLISLVVKLRTGPGETGAGLIIPTCPANMQLRSVSGQFRAQASNGVGLRTQTASLGFSWVRPG